MCLARRCYNCKKDGCSDKTWRDFEQWFDYQEIKTQTELVPINASENVGITDSHIQNAIWAGWQQIDDTRNKAATKQAGRVVHNPSFYLASNIITEIDHRLETIVVNESSMGQWIGERFYIYKHKSDGSRQRVDSVKNVFIKRSIDVVKPFLPELDMIVQHPVILSDGSCAEHTGYYPDDKIFVANDSAPKWNEIKITDASIKEAKEKVFRDLIGDFMFKDDASKATALALLFIPLMRPYIRGQVPITAITAGSAGAGKTLLSNISGLIWRGQALPQVQLDPSKVNKETEIKKSLLSKLMQSPEMIVFDDIPEGSPFDSNALSSASTADIYEDRILGVSRTAKVKVKSPFILNGINLELSIALDRRTQWCRIGTDRDKPKYRDDYRYLELDEHIKAHRFEYMKALMTLVKGWMQAGSKLGKQFLGSYVHYAKVFGGLFDYLDVPGFLDDSNNKDPEDFIKMCEFCENVAELLYDNKKDDDKMFGQKDCFLIASFLDRSSIESENDETVFKLGNGKVVSEDKRGVLDEWIYGTTERSRRTNTTKYLRTKAGAFYGPYHFIDIGKAKDGQRFKLILPEEEIEIADRSEIADASEDMFSNIPDPIPADVTAKVLHLKMAFDTTAFGLDEIKKRCEDYLVEQVLKKLDDIVRTSEMVDKYRLLRENGKYRFVRPIR